MFMEKAVGGLLVNTFTFNDLGSNPDDMYQVWSSVLLTNYTGTHSTAFDI